MKINMKIKLLTVLLLVSIVSCVFAVLAGATSRTDKNLSNKAKAIGSEPSKVAVSQPLQDSTGANEIIDGSEHPERIPDVTAYTLLFRLIANRREGEEKQRIRAYLGEMGLGDRVCTSCQKSNDPTRGTKADVDAIIAAADEFQQRVGSLDLTAKRIKDDARNNPATDAKIKLIKLQRQKQGIVMQIIASLPSRLSVKGLEIFQRHINERVKRNIKMKQANTYTPAPAYGHIG